MNDIIEMYKGMLAFAGMVADDAGAIWYTDENRRKTPVTVQDRHLYLPLSKVLRNFEPTSQMVFHPLTESIMQGESPVLACYRHAVNIKLSVATASMMVALMRVAASADIHPKLGLEQKELLKQVPGAEARSMDALARLITHYFKQHHEKAFVSLYVNRGAVIKGKKYSRGTHVRFPFYQALEKDEFPKTFRAKDLKVIKDLFEYIFPQAATPEEYASGSDSQIAPFLESLMAASVNLAARINDLVDGFGEFIDEPDMVNFTDTWLEAFSNLPKLKEQIRAIPAQEGNDGSPLVAEKLHPRQEVVARQPNTPQAVAERQPAADRQPIGVPIPAYPTTQPQAVAPGQWQPLPAGPGQWAPTPPAPPASGKTSMNEIFSKNPVAAHVAQQMAPNIPMQPQPGVPRDPRFIYDASGRPVGQAPQVYYDSLGRPIQPPVGGTMMPQAPMGYPGQQQPMNAWGQPYAAPMYPTEINTPGWGWSRR